MQKKRMEHDDKLKIIEHVYNNFEHRMDFFWKSYYRLLLYHLTIPIIPFLSIKYVKIDNIDKILLNYLPFVALAIILIGIFSLPSTIKYLIGEDNRVFIVHREYKRRLKELKINLNREDDNNIKTGTIMIKKFYRLVIIFSLLLIYGIFAFIYYGDNNYKIFFENKFFLQTAILIPLFIYLIMTFYMNTFIVKKNSLRY